MAEYIKRETAVKAVMAAKWVDGSDGAMAMEIVASPPAVDVAPVVRCKDCKYSCKDGTGRTCEGYWYELSEFAVLVEDDGFCSYGERKDGGDE